MSLNDIEHGIIRDMNEPRIHFVVNCAAISCPKLRNEAYTAQKLDEQLEDQGNYFLNESGKNVISSDRVESSKIFRWFKEDFTKKGTLVDFLDNYTEEEIKPNATIAYKNYNWELNSIENRSQ